MEHLGTHCNIWPNSGTNSFVLNVYLVHFKSSWLVRCSYCIFVLIENRQGVTVLETIIMGYKKTLLYIEEINSLWLY